MSRMVRNEICAICDSKEWENLDNLRDHSYWFKLDIRDADEPVGFKICKECGFVTYDYLEEEALIQIYENQRPAMFADNLITASRKIQYHEKFFTDMDCTNKRILDVGCAEGTFLSMCKRKYSLNTADVCGAEYSDAFVAFAKKENKVRAAKKIDEFQKEKFDLICYYHALEHLQYPAIELEKAKNMLNNDGILYISVPIWFDYLDEPGGSNALDFENLFHLNHVNVFSYTSFENLLTRSGFRIVKKDIEMYGCTVFCEIDHSIKGINKEDYKEIINIIKNQKKAIELSQKKKFMEALKIYPKFPDAALFDCFSKETMKDFDEQIKKVDEILKICPNSIKLYLQKAKILFQWNENTPSKQYYSNNIKESEKLFLYCLESKPGIEEIYYYLAIIEFKYKKRYDLACDYLKKAININPTKWGEYWNQICHIRKMQESDK